METKQLSIGLFGFGCVGHGLYRVLNNTPSLQTEIRYICVKQKNKSRPLPESNFIYDANTILNDEAVNVVVELIDDADAAYQIVTRALKKGKAVVTANKKMLAEHLDELLALQYQYNVPLLYEASCCASIPVIRNLEEYYDNDLLSGIEGIVNGSTNYILTAMNAGSTYQAALRTAQEKGFAESNPLLDVSGQDACHKLRILLLHAFGWVCKEDILFAGIDRLGKSEQTYAREKGYALKLLAQAFRSEEGIVNTWVMPTFLNKDHPLGQVNDVFNGVVIHSGLSDRQTFIGKGAGDFPTASAVLSDLSALRYNYRYAYRKMYQSVNYTQNKWSSKKVFLRFNQQIPDQVLNWFTKIDTEFKDAQVHCLTGWLPLARIKQILKVYQEASVVLFHASTMQEPPIELLKMEIAHQ